MDDHPSTFEGTPVPSGKHAWQDRAAIHPKNDSGGVLDGAKALRRGTFAEMIRHLASLPAEQRSGYLIKKAGDREYSAQQAIELASRDDFPSGDAS
ncbi:hypothetical protein [Qipengyuania sp. ASV99]|uniref:hypothetical protein n=1 Tax=Qipengyuania sp. ASV99 TaxID=3399681 RepID=UPI003A4C5D23